MNYQNALYSNCCDEALFFSDEDEELTGVAKSPPLPSFSPVPWLQQDAWVSMSRYEKESFMQHIIGGNFQSDQLKGAHKGCNANSIHFNFNDEDIDFGNSVDRVILGSGSRRVLVLVGIHGNEPCGVEAVKMILRKRKLFSANSADVTSEELLDDDNWATTLETLFRNLTIEFLLGSPAALRQNKRFVQRNLNRLFDLNILNDSKLALKDGYRYELHRARLITESIRHADFVLDIHSCSSDVGSFALPSSLDLSEFLAEHLPVKYVVESLVHACLDGGTTLDAALWNDVPGVCVECGQHNHKDVGKCDRQLYAYQSLINSHSFNSGACCNSNFHLSLSANHARRGQSICCIKLTV